MLLFFNINFVFWKYWNWQRLDLWHFFTTRGLSVLCQEDGEGEICISHHEGISAGVDQL